MPTYRLKKRQEEFDVVDGPLAGHQFRRGVEYGEADIPACELRKFDKVVATTEAPATSTKGGKK